MNILHIFSNASEKFSEPYIEFINNNFDSSKHFFYYIGKDERAKRTNRINTCFVSGIKYIDFIKGLHISNKIILHGLFSPNMVLMLFMQPWLLKKTYWVIWGGDLYYYEYRKRSFKTSIYEFLRKKVIKNMRGLITYISGDYELVKKWYKCKGKFYYSYMYLSNTYKEYNFEKAEGDNKKFYIQVGNSSDPSNNHLEVFQKLQRYKNENIEIICPLSYGSLEYRDTIISEGRKMFNNKFRPLIDFLPFDEYLNLLAKVDISIFNHKRQQAMGNIITLLGLGKKVYVRDDITTWGFFIEHGLKVFSSNSNFEDLLDEFEENKRLINIKNVKNKFSKEKLKGDWEKIFNDGVREYE